MRVTPHALDLDLGLDPPFPPAKHQNHSLHLIGCVFSRIFGDLLPRTNGEISCPQKMGNRK